MLNKNDFFKDFYSKKFILNLKKSKKAFKLLKLDLNNLKIPLLASFEKNYVFDFSTTQLKRFSKYENIVLIGMGGSISGAKCIYSFLKTRIRKKVFFFDNLDVNLHLQFKKIKNLNNSCFIIISKSGNTIETVVNLSLIFSKFLLRNKLIFITEMKDNSLINIANKLNAEIVEHKDFIGGRYSVLSETGMLPATLMGLDIKRFKNLQKLIRDKNFASSLIQNVAAIYTLINQGMKNSVILNYDSNLNDLGYWYQQLVSESLGKKGKGITPILSSAPKDHHSILQLYLDGPKDKFFTFFSFLNKKGEYKIPGTIIPNNMKFLKNKNLGSIINAQCNATQNIFRLKNIPFRKIVFRKKNEEELGAIFTFFVLETILLSRLMNVNPFTQPAVEQVKIETEKILSR